MTMARISSLLLLLAFVPACATRTLEITSDPPGATVYLNDQEIGRTPVAATFTHYGTYDVLLVKEGCEPLRVPARARPPVYEVPPLDLPAAAVGARTRIRWHFTLQPALESTLPPETLEADLVRRAGELRNAARPGESAPK